MSGFAFPIRRQDMKARISNPAFLLPETLKALYAVVASLKGTTVPHTTLELMHLRASQINGCAFCIDMHVREAQKAGESISRLAAVAAWRESPHFNEAERAALALAEFATRMSDRPDAVPDSVWDEAARHYSEQELAVLVVNIAMINFWNRVNVTTRQVPPVAA